MSKSNYIIGSGLVAIIIKKILGDNWKIIPFAPSRFYSKGIPALGDDFVVYDASVKEIIKDWGLKDDIPLFFKRPYSVSGSLLYNDMFADRYLDRIGLEDNPLNRSYYKTDFTVFPFSCLDLWKKLLPESIGDIKKFQSDHEHYKSIDNISDHNITLNTGEVLEYDNIISTIPYYALTKMLKIPNTGAFADSYYYYIRDVDNVDIENANQVLICDEEVAFHKCTKLSKDRYVFEIVDNYIEDIQSEFSNIIGSSFEILAGAMVQNGHVYKSPIDDDFLSKQDITCIGSYAQCDPLIDIGSVIKRTHNLLKSQKIKQ